MTCEDCPDENGESTTPEIVVPSKHTTGWIVYTGGSFKLHLAMMQHTLPPDYSRAHFLVDGCIRYEKGPDDWEPPSPIDGYKRDTENPWFFRPLWKSCRLRMFGTEIKEACECIQVIAICNHPETDLNSHGEVPFTMCEACPHRDPIPVLVQPKSRASQGRSGPEPQ